MMPVSDHSWNVFDYLVDLPDLPSRADRDALIKLTQDDPKEEKRVHIWDFFFRLRPEDVGKPQFREIEELRQQREAELRQIRTTFMNWVGFLVAAVVVGAVVVLQRFFPNVSLWGWVIIVTGFGGIIRAFTWHHERRNQISANIGENIRKLTRMVEYLRSKVPRPPSDAQINEWLSEDLDRLGQHAIDRTTSETRFVLIEGVEKPISILGPAKLQETTRIEKSLPNLRGNPDLQKHLDIARWGFFPEERFDIFYGIYYIEFLIVGEDMLANFGCFYDFIANQIYGEHTKEMYYDDVVSIGTRYEYQHMNLPWVSVPNINLPTFSLSLASGETIEVTFASEKYLQAFARQYKERSWQTETWERNPEQVARQVIDALRGQLHNHKLSG